MVGGAPAGINMPPVEEGCRTIRIRIRMMTIHGNRSTAPSGIDIFEFPFKRIRRRKKANLDDIRSFSCEGSFNGGGFAVDGIRFTSFWTKPIVPPLLSPPLFDDSNTTAFSHASLDSLNLLTRSD